MLNLVHHFLEFGLREVLAFTFEHLMQALPSDVPILVLEVVESQLEVLLGKCVSPVHNDRKEVRVVNHSLVLQVRLLKDGLDVHLAHIGFAKGRAEFSDTERPSVALVEQSEFLPERFDVKSSVLHKETQCFELKPLVHMEIHKTLHHSQVNLGVQSGLS